MNRPPWVTIVGIFGIILGSFGILGGGQMMTAPLMMDFQQAFMTDMQGSMNQAAAQSQGGPNPVVFNTMMQRMFQVPDWFRTWCIAAGIVSAMVSGYYVFASIRLLQMAPTAVRTFCTAAGIAIFWGVARTSVAIASMSVMAFNFIGGAMFGIVINVVLLIVVATGDKTAFDPENRGAIDDPLAPPPVP